MDTNGGIYMAFITIAKQRLEIGRKILGGINDPFPVFLEIRQCGVALPVAVAAKTPEGVAEEKAAGIAKVSMVISCVAISDASAVLVEEV